MNAFELVEPSTLEEALELLDCQDPAVRPIGGGTALMLMMKAQVFEPIRLVSLRRVGAPFTGFAVDEAAGAVDIGAMTTFSELEHSPQFAQHLPVVPQTMRTLANVRVRNVATVGGNLAHGDPHLDLPPVWSALDAEATLVSRGGERTVPVIDLFAGYYETAIEDGEILSRIRVPLRPDWRSRYFKITTRAAHDWPALSIALSLLQKGNVIEDCRIVIGAAVDKPTRLVAAEAVLRGARADDTTLASLGDAAAEEAQIESDSRGGADYKNQLLRVHLARGIKNLTGLDMTTGGHDHA